MIKSCLAFLSGWKSVARDLKLRQVVGVGHHDDLTAQLAYGRPRTAAARQHDAAQGVGGGGVVVRAQVGRRVELVLLEHLGPHTGIKLTHWHTPRLSCESDKWRVMVD